MAISTLEQIISQRWSVRENGDANSYTILGDGNWIMAILMNGHPGVDTQRGVMKAVALLPEMLVALRDAADRLEQLVARDQQKLLDCVALEKAQKVLRDLNFPIPTEIT